MDSINEPSTRHLSHLTVAIQNGAAENGSVEIDIPSVRLTRFSEYAKVGELAFRKLNNRKKRYI